MSRQMVHSVVTTTKKTDQVANKQHDAPLILLRKFLCLSENIQDVIRSGCFPEGGATLSRSGLHPCVSGGGRSPADTLQGCAVGGVSLNVRGP